MSAASSIDIRVNKPSDFPAIMELVKTCYGDKAEPPEWWRWRHFDPNISHSIIYLAIQGDKVVGMRPMALFPYSLHEKLLIGALFSAVMVHPQFRRQGIFRSLVNACVEEAWRLGADFVNTMPNDLSYPGFINMGWNDPGDRTLLVRPLNLIDAAKRKIKPVWLGAIVGAFPQIVVKKIEPKDTETDVNVREIDLFDSAADTLADSFASKYNGLVLRRDCQWLNWRYSENSWNSYRRLEARTEDFSLKGIAVTNLESRKNIRVGYLVELIGKARDVRFSLTSAAVRKLRKDGANIVFAVMSNRDSIFDLKAQGFYSVPKHLSPKKFHMVYLPRPDKAMCLAPMRRIENWYQTLGDWDGI